MMHIFFDQESHQTCLNYVIEFNQLMASSSGELPLLRNIYLAFHLNSITLCYKRLGQIATLEHHLIIDLRKFAREILIHLSDQAKNFPNKNLLLHFIIDAYFCLCEESLNLKDENLIYEFLKAIDLNDDDNYILYDLIASKFDPNKTGKFLWTFYNKFQSEFDPENERNVKKVLNVICALLAKLEEEDFHKLELLDEIDLGDESFSDHRIGQNVVEFLIQEVILHNIAKTAPEIRQLSVKALGLACLTNFILAQSYLQLLTQVTIF